MSTRRCTHTIRELPEGWLHKEWGRTYKTLRGVIRAMDGYEKKIVQSGIFGSVVSVRDWEATTEAGRSTLRGVLKEEE